MNSRARQAVCVLMTAVTVLATAAFAPERRERAAWWCTAFSLTCRESTQENEGETVEFRLRILDIFR